jgi:hypothetical protein
MRANHVGYLIATAVSFGMCATSVRAQDNRYAASPLPSTATADAPDSLARPMPSRVVPVSFCDTCDTCNSGCDCDKFGCCGECQNPAGFVFKWAPDKWAKVGGGVRTSFSSTTGVPNVVTPGGSGASLSGPGGNFFRVNDARIYVSGKVAECVGFELNTEINNEYFQNNTSLSYPSSVNLLDAIVKYEFDDAFNIWAGQLLPPSDRANLSGPFFINAWDFPFVQNYPDTNNGREIGVSYWGSAGDGFLQWSVGAFNGTGRTTAFGSTNGEALSVNGVPNPPLGFAPSNPNGHPLQFAARVEVDLLNPEKGYYKQGTYYGTKGDLLNIGYVIQTQNNSVGVVGGGPGTGPRNFTGMNVDALYETVFENCGVLTVEGAWYHYNDQNLVATPGVPLTFGQAAQQGNAEFIFVGYLAPQIWLPCTCVEGRVRPWARYQNYHHDDLADSVGFAREETEVGADYIINGHSARLTAFWGQLNRVAASDVQIFRIGAQVNF